MRVDFVITELFVGGAERCLTELALGLQQSGDHVRVFSLGSLPRGDQRLLVDRLESAGIEVTSGRADRSSQFLRAYRELKVWLSGSPPEICQTFLFHANVLGTEAACSTGVGIRVGGLRVAESKRLRCLIERRAVRRMQSLICVSHAVQRFATSQFGTAADRSIVIPNGVDVARFASAQPLPWSRIGWPDDSIVSLFVGRFHHQKGIERLQQQINVLAPADSKRRLLLVGNGPLRGSIQAWADELGHERVQVLSWQPDIAPIIRACRLLVLPSHYEGMPNVVLEAMAAGRPVVCSRVEGIRELLADDLDRQSFAVDAIDEMQNLVEPFLVDETLAKHVGEQNQARVKRDFSIAAMVDAYRCHYRELRTRRLDDA